MPAITHIEPISDTKTYENNAIGKEMRAKICNIFGPINTPKPNLCSSSSKQENKKKIRWIDKRHDLTKPKNLK